MHTLSPPMFLRDGEPEIVFGTMGGDGQPQILLQLLHQLVDRGLDVQRALDHPRWVYGRHTLTERPDLQPGETVIVESRMPADDRRGSGTARPHGRKRSARSRTRWAMRTRS